MKRKKAWIIAGIAAVICAAGGTGLYLQSQRENAAEAPVLPDGMTFSEGAVAATGLTSVGMMEETCSLGFLENGLYVEETYLNMGDEVEAHTPVFQVSEESLESARRELEKEVQETALNRRQGEITYAVGLVEAQKEMDLAAVEAQYAQDIYDIALKTAQDEVDARQEAVDSAQEKVDEYTASIEEDYYYTYYEVGELEAVWKDNAAYLMELYYNWNVEALEDIYGGSGGKNGIGYVTNQVSQTTSGASAASGAASGSAQSGSAPEASGGVFFALEQTADISGEEAETDEAGDAAGTDGAGDAAGTDGAGDAAGTDEAGDTAGTDGAGDAAGTDEADDAAGTDEADDAAGANEADDTAGNDAAEAAAGKGTESMGMERAAGGFMGGGSVSGNDIPAMTVNVSDDEIRYNIYLAMVEETEESEAAYESALESYEEAKATAAAGLEEAKSELAVLRAKLAEQQNAYEEAAISAKLTYDMAISDHESAQMVYETTVKQLEEDYDALIEEEETAAENLALFEETIGDGTFYTSSAGTVMMTAIRADSWLTEDTIVMAYSNPDTVTIAASVAQEDIASIEIGDEAYAVVSGYGSYAGKVTSLNPVSASGGSSSVSYTVNVLLEDDVSGLEANLTAYVYFGLTEEEKEMLGGSMSRGGQDKEGDAERPDDGLDGQPADFSDMEMPQDTGQWDREGGGDMPGGEAEGGDMPGGRSEGGMPGGGRSEGGMPGGQRGGAG